MTVTGSDWQALTLGKLIPALDPDKPGSMASKMKDKIKNISGEITTGIGKVTDITEAVTNTLDTVAKLGDEIKDLQNEIDNLVGNAVNTGVYMHLLGCSPLFSSTQPSDISNELTDAFTDIDDPNRPQFTGTMASLGGILLVVSAPSADALLSQVSRLGIIFPIFKKIVNTFKVEGEELVDIFTEDFAGSLQQNWNLVNGQFTDVADFEISTQPFEDLFEESVNEFKDFSAGDVDAKWIALRVADMIPSLNPSLGGSPANLIINTERDLVNGGASLLQQAKGLSLGVQQITDGINIVNRELQSLASTVTNLVDSLGRTGLYIHMLGNDGKIKSTAQLNSAASRCMLDTTDNNRPHASGKSSFFCGMITVYGAANPAGFVQKLSGIQNVFGGLKGGVKSIGKSFKF